METVVFGVGDAANQRLVQDYLARVETKINSQEDALEKLSDAELKGMTAKLRARLAAGESENDILDDAFAVVREAAWRVLKMRHYDVQVQTRKKSMSLYIRV
jgi:preprotein translocase subunit SecA